MIMSSNLYYPTKSIIEYFEANGKQFSISDEEFVKFVEIFYVFFYIHTTQDEVTCSSETQEKRKSICSNCTYYNKGKDSCNLCGCIIKDKVIVPVEMCPMRKWNMDLDLLKTHIGKVVTFIDDFLKTQNKLISLEDHEKSFESINSETNE